MIPRGRQLREIKCVREVKERAPAARRIPSVILSNVRSINNKIDEVEVLLRDHKPDIAVFTETWLDDEIPNQAIDIDRYSSLRRDRNSLGGGILCYISKELKVNVVDVPSVTPLSCDTEFLPLYIDNLRLLVICCYHPVWNNMSKHNEAISIFVHIIDFVLSSPKYHPDSNVILCGDFNDLHKFRSKICSVTRLACHVFAPTRLDNSLDLVFSSYATDVRATTLSPLGRSDHRVVLWKPSAKVRSSFIKTFVRKFTKRGAAWFHERVIHTDWLALVKHESKLDDAASVLLSCLNYLFDIAFPVRSVRIRHNDPLWLTPQLRLLMNERDKAMTGGQSRRFERLREEIAIEIKKSKSRLLRKVSSSTSSKFFWQSVKKISRYSVSRVSPESISCESFNDYFSSVYNSNCADDSSNCSFSCFEPLPDVPLELSVLEVDRVFRKVRKTSPGPDGLPAWIFKDFSFCISPAVTYIFNRSLSEGHVPLCFKQAIIIPIPKISNPLGPSDFRPISLLPVVSKVFEKLVARFWILPYIKHMDGSQFAYLPRIGSGTSTALTLIYDSIIRFLDSTSGAVRLMALDFAKAFDSLPHDAILRACVRCGLPSQTIQWLRSYLNDRSQCTRCSNSVSPWSSVPCGVAQGSVLGPLLFCISISSLNTVCHNSRIIKYADDVTLLHFMRNSYEDNLQAEFDNVVSWSRREGLCLNFSKCFVSNFITKKTIHCSSIFAPSGNVISEKDSIKILGVTFSNNFLWNKHVDNVVSKASKRIFVLRNLKRSGCEPNILLHVYKTLVRSVLSYAYPCFCNAPKYLHESLLKVEKRAFRIIFNRSFHEDNFEHACIKLCQNLFNKIVTLESHPLRSLFLPRAPTPRNVCPLRPPITKTSRFKTSFIKFCG
jgi:hypothetical protein